MRLAIAALASFLSTVCRADSLIVSDLTQSCASTDRVEEMLCSIYIKGLTDGLRRLNDTVKAGERTYCPPGELPGDEAKTVILSYFKKHLELSDASASQPASVALFEAYPCRSK